MFLWLILEITQIIMERQLLSQLVETHIIEMETVFSPLTVQHNTITAQTVSTPERMTTQQILFQEPVTPQPIEQDTQLNIMGTAVQLNMESIMFQQAQIMVLICIGLLGK